jgi:NAD(P)-dependent dehydrogenase (short-subunit alcohol dehydrogenase family)
MWRVRKLSPDAVRQTFGNLDVLFVNAGVVDMRPIEQMDEADLIS